MVLTVDHLDDRVLVWSCTGEGATARTVTDYTPTFYVGEGVADLFADRAGPEAATVPGDEPRPTPDDLADPLPSVRSFLERRPSVRRTRVERHRQTVRSASRPVLRVDVDHVDAVRPTAARVHERCAPGAVTCYDVDHSREFRFCLERGVDPTPSRDLRTTDLGFARPRHELGVESLVHLTVDGERLGSRPPDVLRRLDDHLADANPDVLLVDTAELVPTLYEAAEAYGVALELGRRPGWQRLAGASTYTSYGRVGHSPARYDVPGRVVVDRANTFFLGETTLAGCRALVERSGKPLQELGWASIGNVLTAMQIRHLRERDVLVPWLAWRPEFFKSARVLHDADRGGYTFAPDVGVHEAVHELDFASLYPSIICTRNVSPERIRCACCDGEERGETVPGLGYTVCEDPGYLPDVLGPVVEDRADMKAARAATDDPDEVRELTGRIDALKWILVSCFGYQGFSNAKFGRIECHEAINAYAREILLDAKETLEAAGWRVVHGIVDSLWVTAREGASQEPLDSVAARVSDEARIELEYEAAYDWIAFVPLRDSEAGTLTKYFGRQRDGAYTYKGIECRQRSTPPFVAEAQRDLVETFDATRSPAAVCRRLAEHVAAVEDGAVDPTDFVRTVRVSKAPDDYAHRTRTVCALQRAADQGAAVHPGTSVEYVVVDDDARGRDRVRLAHEPVETYDAGFYVDLLVRAAESVLSPVGWREREIRAELADSETRTLTSY